MSLSISSGEASRKGATNSSGCCAVTVTMKMFSVKKKKIINVNDFSYSQRCRCAQKGCLDSDRSQLSVMGCGMTFSPSYSFQYL